MVIHQGVRTDLSRMNRLVSPPWIWGVQEMSWSLAMGLHECKIGPPAFLHVGERVRTILESQNELSVV
jgi:hypothetical protein